MDPKKIQKRIKTMRDTPDKPEDLDRDEFIEYLNDCYGEINEGAICMPYGEAYALLHESDFEDQWSEYNSEMLYEWESEYRSDWWDEHIAEQIEERLNPDKKYIGGCNLAQIGEDEMLKMVYDAITLLKDLRLNDYEISDIKDMLGSR
jgi:hypothetical protein